jgi:hypothetical protein
MLKPATLSNETVSGVQMALPRSVCVTDPPAATFCAADIFVIERIKLIHE